MKVGIISCGSTKKNYPCPASEMYEDGRFFSLLKSYVEENYDRYYILSGHYGLLDPEQIIEPYPDTVFFVQKIFRDKAKKEGRTLKAVPKEQQRQWGIDVANAIDWNQFDKVDFHINIYYWKNLEPHFTDLDKFEFHKFARRLGPAMQKYR